MVPSEIGNMINLKELKLGVNQLTGSIPPEIGNLNNLNFLDLGSNQLNGSIPPEIGNLTKLIGLYYSSNQMTGSIPQEILNLTNLTTFHVNDNEFSYLPNISSLPNIVTLKIENNIFTFDDIEPNIGVASGSFTYAPQDSVGPYQNVTLNLGETLNISVSVDGGRIGDVLV